MKCPKCGTELVWMGDVTILIRDTDKYFNRLSKKAFRSKDIELMSADWENGELFCPNYLNCGYHPSLWKRIGHRINGKLKKASKKNER